MTFSQDILNQAIANSPVNYKYLGVTVMQVIAGTVFNSQLKRQLTVHAGLNASQINLLLGGGTKNARETINENFPTLFVPTLEAYNSAVTRAFVSLALLY